MEVLVQFYGSQLDPPVISINPCIKIQKHFFVELYCPINQEHHFCGSKGFSSSQQNAYRIPINPNCATEFGTTLVNCWSGKKKIRGDLAEKKGPFRSFNLTFSWISQSTPGKVDSHIQQHEWMHEKESLCWKEMTTQLALNAIMGNEAVEQKSSTWI